MTRNPSLIAALTATFCLAAPAVLAAPVEIVNRPDSLNFIDLRNPVAGGSISQALRDARDVNFRGQLTTGSTPREDGLTSAPYSVSPDGAGGFFANSLAGPIDLLGGTLQSVSGVTRIQTNLTGMAGRFNTTATTPACVTLDPPTAAAIETCNSRWIETTGSIQIDFGTGFGAFGFYGTDVGDFNGTLLLELLGGPQAVSITLGDFAGSNGAAMFFGFFDSENLYSGVRLSAVGSQGRDFFGFDDFIVGQVGDDGGGGNPNPMPEPGSLALVGASLLTLMRVRRRRAG